eukprot:TRINITY_DN17236_c0_g1_i1.p1 TRINITY_DN17236_c0_g1~~TRINITY_DN17236_c0_g1_i1.p1  ORF type:complete len:52 (+),score=6.58 TRINITY_DN17236_c0_g1_i1:90-245(+)
MDSSSKNQKFRKCSHPNEVQNPKQNLNIINIRKKILGAPQNWPASKLNIYM